MNKRQKKILEFAKNNQSFRNKDLIMFFDEKYSRITITRDLVFLVSRNFLKKEGKGAHTFYSLADNFDVVKNINIEEYFAIDFQKRDIKETFNFEIFDILEKTEIFNSKEKGRIEELQKEFVKNFSKYDSQTLINKEFERIMIEFSWKSSAIEGNTYSLLSTEALIKENVSSIGKSNSETQMILNHKDAFNESIQNKGRFRKLDYKDIEYIHKILTKELEITQNIRNSAVGVAGTKYKPLNNEFQIKEAVEKMVSLINKKELFFEKAFLSLILLSYIQAFEDGNKRTARMLSNAILLAHNSIPLSYRIVDVVEYKKASLLFYEVNNFSYFKEIFIEQFEDAVNNYFK